MIGSFLLRVIDCMADSQMAGGWQELRKSEWKVAETCARLLTHLRSLIMVMMMMMMVVVTLLWQCWPMHNWLWSWSLPCTGSTSLSCQTLNLRHCHYHSFFPSVWCGLNIAELWISTLPQTEPQREPAQSHTCESENSQVHLTQSRPMWTAPSETSCWSSSGSRSSWSRCASTSRQAACTSCTWKRSTALLGSRGSWSLFDYQLSWSLRLYCNWLLLSRHLRLVTVKSWWISCAEVLLSNSWCIFHHMKMMFFMVVTAKCKW